MRLRNGRLLDAMAVLFIAPNVLFASYLTFVPMAVLLAGSASALTLIATRKPPCETSFLAKPIDLPRLLVCAASALALLLLAGGGHLLYANWDWLFRDAVLADLGRTGDLPRYAVDGHDFLLRAPLGMYLVPALAVHLASLGAGHVALLVQDTCLLTGLLYLVAGASSKRWFVTVLVFVVFSGLDIVGLPIWHAIVGKTVSLDTIPSQIETWGGYQYSSHVTQLFWVPNHCLPGWWLALLALLCVRRDIEAGELGISLAASLLWSPLAVAGALPLAAVALLLRLRETIGSLRFWAAAASGLGFVPIALYLTGDSAEVPHGLLVGHPGFWIAAPVFLLVEIPLAAVVLSAWPTLSAGLRRLLPPAIATLVLLPAFRIGTNNDLVMRGSIPALALLAIATGDVLAQGWRQTPVRFSLALLLVALGAVTPAFEMVRPFIFSRYAISNCNLVTAAEQAAPGQSLSNYLARPDRMPRSLLTPAGDGKLLTREAAACWPDYPFDPTLGVWDHTNAELLRSGRSRAGSLHK